MSSNKSKYDNVFQEFKKIDKEIQDFGKILGKGAFGEVREVRICSKIYAAKLVEKEKSDNIEPEKLRGSNIIKIFKISEKHIFEKYYDLIIMEKAVLKDIGTLVVFLCEKNLLKLINIPFNGIMSDNLLRYFVYQIIDGLETLERSELVHFDIKPENLLITTGLNLKISDFSFLKSLRREPRDFKIPGGTAGFVSPEYYRREKINGEMAKKQDYFALGATIYYLKFNHRLLKYKKYDDNKYNENRVIDILQKKIPQIKSNLFLDKDYIDFVCSLIEYGPDDRPTFEEIYRNKWLNKTRQDVHKIKLFFCEGEEDKQMRELIKSDYLLMKKKELKTCNKFTFKGIQKSTKNKIVL
jgi:serine/threonine protein kinase